MVKRERTFSIPFYTDLISELKISWLKNGATVLEKYLYDCEIEDFEVFYTLSQKEMALLGYGNVDVRANILTNDGNVLKTKVYAN
jgi:hypothetical protein